MALKMSKISVLMVGMLVICCNQYNAQTYTSNLLSHQTSYAPTPLFFTYDKVFTHQYHQPVTRVDIITNDPNSYDVSSRIQLQRSVLTEDEKKVFAAWNRRAAEHPLP
jgi:hypothetical protein